MSKNDAWHVRGDHVRLSVRLIPSGGRNCIDGLEMEADGHCHLKVRVTAIPEGGKANTALIALISKTLKRSKSSITIISSETARKKILRLDGEPEDLNVRLRQIWG